MTVLLFTKSNLLFSKLIRFTTKEPVSHCALRVDSWVIHSSAGGLIIEKYREFAKRVTIAFKVNLPTHYSRLFRLVANYTRPAHLLPGLNLLARSWFHLPLPKQNLWQITGMHLCTEWITRHVDSKEDSMITPYKLYLRLKETTTS